MEIQITVPAEYLAVLKLFAADMDVRYYLNGIHLEIGREETLLVASNGAMLGCFRVESEQPDVDAPLTRIIIPNNLLTPIKSTGVVEIAIGEPETKENAEGEEVPVSNARPVKLTYAGLTMRGEALDGEFPDFRRVIPPKVSGRPAQFDPRYLGTLAKAWSILHSNKGICAVGIGYNGEKAALIDLGVDNFVGVIMPMRHDDAPRTAPAWWTDLVGAKKKTRCRPGVT